jgi:hypothetical protein
MAIVFRLPAAQVVDANGNPLSGAKLYFYERGTTTPKNVFSDESLTTPVSQPAVANSAGQWAQIYMSADRYRVQLYTSADVLVADYDNFDPGQPVSATAGVLPLTLGGTGVTSLSALQSLLGLGAAATWTDVASAATVDLGAVPSSNVRITGTTTITSFGTVASGTTRQLRFAAALTLTHNATSLILPGTANITTAADDTAVAVSLGSGNWIVVDYQRASGKSTVGASLIDYQAFTSVGAGTWTKPAGAVSSDAVMIMAWGGGGGGAVAANGAGGGGGACAWLITTAGRLGATESISVGAAGTAGGAPGGNGGNSTVNVYITGFGGGGGGGGAGGGGGGVEGAGATSTAGAGFGVARAFGGATAGASASAFFGGGAGATTSSAAGQSVFGGGGGGAATTNTVGAFSSVLGTGGGAGGVNGAAGGVACGGGGGSTTAGAGGRGEVRIWTFRSTGA